MAIGKNARGTAPVKAKPVGLMRIRVADREIDMRAVSRLEVAMITLRADTTATIGWACAHRVESSQPNMFGGV